MKAYPYEKIDEETVRVVYGRDIFTFNPEAGETVSADNNGSSVLDTRVFVDIDDENLYTD